MKRKLAQLGVGSALIGPIILFSFWHLFQFHGYEKHNYLAMSLGTNDFSSVFESGYIWYLGSFRPVVKIYHILQHSLFGCNPSLYYQSNLTLWFGSAFFIFLICKIVSGSLVLSALLSVFYILDTRMMTTSYWLTSAHNALATFFGFFAVYLHQKTISSKGNMTKGRWSVILTLLLISVLSKETGLCFLLYFFFFLSFQRTQRTRMSLLVLVPFTIYFAMFLKGISDASAGETSIESSSIFQNWLNSTTKMLNLTYLQSSAHNEYNRLSPVSRITLLKPLYFFGLALNMVALLGLIKKFKATGPFAAIIAGNILIGFSEIGFRNQVVGYGAFTICVAIGLKVIREKLTTSGRTLWWSTFFRFPSLVVIFWMIIGKSALMHSSFDRYTKRYVMTPRELKKSSVASYCSDEVLDCVATSKRYRVAFKNFLADRKQEQRQKEKLRN